MTRLSGLTNWCRFLARMLIHALLGLLLICKVRIISGNIEIVPLLYHISIFNPGSYCKKYTSSTQRHRWQPRLSKFRIWSKLFSSEEIPPWTQKIFWLTSAHTGIWLKTSTKRLGSNKNHWRDWITSHHDRFRMLGKHIMENCQATYSI